MPHGYFNAEAAKLLNEFQQNAELYRQEELMDVFPECAVGDTLQNPWHASAICVYRNWLHFMMSKRAATTPVPATIRVGNR
jgi:hypothetical protein